MATECRCGGSEEREPPYCIPSSLQEDERAEDGLLSVRPEFVAAVDKKLNSHNAEDRSEVLQWMYMALNLKRTEETQARERMVR